MRGRWYKTFYKRNLTRNHKLSLLGQSLSFLRYRDTKHNYNEHICKHWTSLEGLARDKHSSLLQKSLIMDIKGFITSGQGALFTTTHFLRNLIGVNKLECLSLASLSSLVYCSTSLLVPSVS